MADENVKTEEEKIAEAVAAKEKEWQDKYTKQVNEASKAERLKYEKELEKAKLTESERLAAEAKEEKERLIAENTSLKQEKSVTVKKTMLNEAKLPSFYINDVRLAGAKDEDELKSVIKTITKEHNDYLSSLGKQNQSTSPQVGSTLVLTNEQLAELATTNPEEYRRLRREQKEKGKR